MFIGIQKYPVPKNIKLELAYNQRLPRMQKRQENMINNGENKPAAKTDSEMTQMLADKDIKSYNCIP